MNDTNQQKNIAAPELEEGPPLKQILSWLGDEDSHEFRPVLRPPVPVLTVLDDGSQETGEEHRIRTESFSIGRTTGHLVLPNDPSLSGTHAEIRRLPWKGAYQWHLCDLGSVNGSFVRSLRSVFYETSVMIIGSRRFRLRNPLRPSVKHVSTTDTNRMDAVSAPETVWPVLIEASEKPDAIQLPLRSEAMTIGRTGGGADIELDDPLVADTHATLKRMPDGSWLMVAEPTRNGVWVSISSIMLTGNCLFRLGEQRFRFTLP